MSSLAEATAWDSSQAASAEDSFHSLWPFSCRPGVALRSEMATPLDRFVYRVGHIWKYLEGQGGPEVSDIYGVKFLTYELYIHVDKNQVVSFSPSFPVPGKQVFIYEYPLISPP